MQNFDIENPVINPFFEQIKILFLEMDMAYEKIASSYQFHCNGCTDNCCFTKFYHHTLSEYLFLKKGVSFLSQSTQDQIRTLAQTVVNEYKKAENSISPSRISCPLNENGQCLVYHHRPMICRLHGIPSFIRHPIKGQHNSPGCHMFDKQVPHIDLSRQLNRTPFYIQLSKLEQQLRAQTGFQNKLKLTIAEMLI